jgi:alginate O-acetyltransferase complex protein AlgJ
MGAPVGGRGHRAGRVVRAVIAVVAVVFLFAPLAALVVGGRATAFENRRLAGFPSPGDGWAALTDLPGWLGDHLPLRQQAIQASTAISEHVFHDPPGVGAGGTTPLPGGGSAGPSALATRGWPGAPYPEVLLGRNGYLYYGGDVATKCKSKVSPADVIARLSYLAAEVSASGRQFVLVVPPDKSTIAPENLPGRYDGEQCAQARTAAVWPQLATLPEFVDLRGPLRRLAATPLPGPLYLPKDTHWDGPAAAEFVDALVARIDPAVSGSLHARPQPDEHHVADLATLLGRADEVTVHPVDVADPAVTHLYRTVYSDISTPRYYVSSGPAGTVVRPPTVLLGDSFALAAGSTLPSVFGDLTVVHHETAGTDPATITDAIVASKVVVLEVVERDLLSANTPVLSPTFLLRVGAVLSKHPWP